MTAGLILCGVALLCIVGTWMLDRSRRKLADQPTSPAAGVFAGRNEVAGRAWVEVPLSSRVTSTPTVMWQWKVEEEYIEITRGKDSDGKDTETRTKKWRTVESDSSQVVSFEVVDDSGSVVVLLHEAKVTPRVLHREEFERRPEGGFWSRMLTKGDATGRYRETEEGVVVGEDVFVVGFAALDDATARPIIRNEKGTRLSVSTRSEQSQVRSLGWFSAITAVVGLVLSGLASALLIKGDDHPGESLKPVNFIPGVAVVVVLLLVVYGITLYNRLRAVANSVERAVALVEVQLQRRSDLIPNLAHIVAGAAEHERGVLQSIASARSTPTTHDRATIDQATAQQTDQARQVIAIAERYPVLTSNDVYQRLMAELADTENRVAASRHFVNDAITIMQDRRRSFPGVLLASFLPAPPIERFAADVAERSVPQVNRTFAA